MHGTPMLSALIGRPVPAKELHLQQNACVRLRISGADHDLRVSFLQRPLVHQPFVASLRLSTRLLLTYGGLIGGWYFQFVLDHACLMSNHLTKLISNAHLTVSHRLAHLPE